MNYGKILKNERQKLGMSVEQFAQMTGITKRAIYYWESGERIMSIENADKVFKALGVSVVIGKDSGTTRLTYFDVLRGLTDVGEFSKLAFEIMKKVKTPEELQEYLSKQLTGEGLQTVLSIAQTGNFPLSLNGLQ